jgi:hypothetical protein
MLMVTRNGAHEKQEHALSFTFKSAGAASISGEIATGRQFRSKPEGCILAKEAAERQEVPPE